MTKFQILRKETLNSTLNSNLLGGYVHMGNKEYYKGKWENGFPNGHGTMTYPNGSDYTGHFSNGKQHGQGRYKVLKILLMKGHLKTIYSNKVQ